MTTNKDLANLFAECALRGFTLHHLAGDYGPLYIVTRDELTRQFNHPTEVWLWLLRVGSQRGGMQVDIVLANGTPAGSGAV